MAERSFLRVQLTMASQVQRAGGFLRYIQFRDKHQSMPELEVGRSETVDGFLRYMAYRDRTQSSRMAHTFGPEGDLGNRERKEFERFVQRSVSESRPQHYRDANTGEWIDGRRAMYRILISPEHGRGLDLERVTRAAVGRLQEDSGAKDLRWFAAEHHNTQHPHVHLVIAAMREGEPGRFQEIRITRPRLAAMKLAVINEIERQRELTPEPERVAPTNTRVTRTTPPRSMEPARSRVRRREMRRPQTRRRAYHSGHALNQAMLRFRAASRRYARQIEREMELEEERRRHEKEFSR